MHRMRRDLHLRYFRRRAGDRTSGVRRKDRLGHEDVPALPRLAAGIYRHIRTVPDDIGTAGTASLDPWENADHGRRRADLNWRAPFRPAAGRGSHADEVLALGRGVAAETWGRGCDVIVGRDPGD